MFSRIHTKKIGVYIGLIFLLLSFGSLVRAVEDPEMKDKTGIAYYCLNGDCTFADLITATKKLVNFGTEFALIFSVVVIAWAGFKYMTSEGNPDKIKEANGMFLNVAKGIVIVLAAWLIVNLITTALLKPGISNIIPSR